MANVKITDLTAYTDAASTDVLAIVDVSNDVTKKISISTLLKATPLGSAAAPAIAIDGDPNTGIYSPGADQLAISTGGTGWLFVDASGRVGINNPSPGTILHIGDPGTGLNFSNGAGGQLNIGLLGGTSSADAYVFNRANSPLIFGTNNQERVRIDSSGFLGVGTSSPAAQLHVYGTYGYFQDGTYTGYFGKGNGTVVGAGTADLGISTSTGAIAFGTGASLTERMRLDASGRLGVGTSSPNQKLEVAGGTIRAGDNQATNGSLILDGNYAGSDTLNTFGSQFSSASTVIGYAVRPRAGATGYTSTAGSYSFHKAALEVGIDGPLKLLYSPPATTPIGNVVTMTEMLRVDTAGRVGIGTISPGYALDVVGTVNSNALFRASNGTHIALLGSEAFSAGVVGVGSGSNHPLVFGTNSIERARIDSSGRLLVGTSATTSSSTAVLQGFNGVSTNPAVLRLNVGVATPANGDALGYLTFGNSDHYSNGQIAAFRDGGTWTNGTSMPTRLVFSTTADGASTPTERMRIGSNGILGSFSAASTDAFIVSNEATAGTTRKFISGRYGALGMFDGTESFFVYTNGNVQNTNNSYGAISDIKLKENIVDANSQWDDLKALQVRNYNFKEGQTHTQIGLIAQEVELVSPGLVSESPDRDAEGNDLGTVTKSVNYSVLYMKAVKALQEAMERIETLEAKVAALEGV